MRIRLWKTKWAKQCSRSQLKVTISVTFQTLKRLWQWRQRWWWWWWWRWWWRWWWWWWWWFVGCSLVCFWRAFSWTKQSRILATVVQQGAGHSDGKVSVEMTDIVLGFQTSPARPFVSSSMKLETDIQLNYGTWVQFLPHRECSLSTLERPAVLCFWGK